jgi:hypothetical protein
MKLQVAEHGKTLGLAAGQALVVVAAQEAAAAAAAGGGATTERLENWKGLIIG